MAKVGDIIHVVDETGIHRAAVVVAVHPDDPNRILANVMYADESLWGLGVGAAPTVIQLDACRVEDPLYQVPKTWHTVE
jgi:hypothetical protein